MNQPADNRRNQNDKRKRQIKGKYRKEGKTRGKPVHRPFQRLAGDPEQCMEDNCQHRTLDPVENRCGETCLAIGRINPGQQPDDQSTGNNKQQPGNQAPAQTMGQPADIGSKLHGFRPRQQHAEIQRVQKPVIGNPFAVLNDLAMHQRNLASRSAKGQQSDLRPDGKHLGKGRGFDCCRCFSVRHAQYSRR